MPPLDDRPTFPADLAWVIKLHKDSDPATGAWRGRIEHVVSGRQLEFADAGELLARLAGDLERVARDERSATPIPDRSFDR